MLVVNSVTFLAIALLQMVVHSILPGRLATNAVRLVTSPAIAHRKPRTGNSMEMSTSVFHLLLPLLLL